MVFSRFRTSFHVNIFCHGVTVFVFLAGLILVLSHLFNPAKKEERDLVLRVDIYDYHDKNVLNFRRAYDLTLIFFIFSVVKPSLGEKTFRKHIYVTIVKPSCLLSNYHHFWENISNRGYRLLTFLRLL